MARHGPESSQEPLVFEEKPDLIASSLFQLESQTQDKELQEAEY